MAGIVSKVYYNNSINKSKGLETSCCFLDENVKKTIGFISKTTALHVHHIFLYISFPFLHDYDVKMPNFVFYGGRKQATTKCYFSF